MLEVHIRISIHTLPFLSTILVPFDLQPYGSVFGSNGMEANLFQVPGLDVGGRFLSVFDVESLDELTGVAIRIDNHCFGCTAGAGSSCQGAVG